MVKRELPLCQIFSVGSFPTKTYLPCADIDMVLFLPRDTSLSSGDVLGRKGGGQQHYTENANCGDESGRSNSNVASVLLAVNQALCMVASKRGGKRGVDTPNRFTPACEIMGKPEIRNVSFINARTPMVKMLVGNVVVDVTENQAGSVAASALMEEADRFIQRNHLFKRSMLLIKAWALCETPRLVGQRVLGAREGGLTSYGLSVMVLHLFSSRSSADTLLHPLDVFVRFFQVFAEFDWADQCLTLDGPVPFDERNRVSPSMSKRGCRLWPMVEKVSVHLPSPTFEKPTRIRAKRASKFVRRSDGHDSASRAPSAGVDSQPLAHFPRRDCNIQDPLNPLNNLGHSVSRRSLKALEYALQQGRLQLEQSPLWPQNNDSQLRPCQTEPSSARRSQEGSNGLVVGSSEGTRGEQHHGISVVKPDFPPQTVAPLVISTVTPPAIPQASVEQTPFFRFPQVPPVHRGVVLGLTPGLPNVGHVVTSGDLQYCLAQPHSLVQVVPPLCQFLYDPFIVRDGRVSAAPSAPLFGGPGQRQMIPNGATLLPATRLQERPELARQESMHRSASQPLFSSDQRDVANANTLECWDQLGLVAGMQTAAAPATHPPRPHSAPWRVDRPISRSFPSATNFCKDVEKEGGGVLARERFQTGRAKVVDHEQFRRQAFMRPWQLPTFVGFSQSSSTASMSEPTEDGSKDEQERQSLSDSVADDESQHSVGTVRHAGPSWPNKEDPLPSNCPAPGKFVEKESSGHRGRKGRGAGSGASESPKSGSSLWANWFLRDFFPHCCQRYGAGDGFREDLLDHPCQHWGNVRPAAAALRPDSRDVLTGAYADMWCALEDAGKMVHGVPRQPRNVCGKEMKPIGGRPAAKEEQERACKGGGTGVQRPVECRDDQHQRTLEVVETGVASTASPHAASATRVDNAYWSGCVEEHAGGSGRKAEIQQDETIVATDLIGEVSEHGMCRMLMNLEYL